MVGTWARTACGVLPSHCIFAVLQSNRRTAANHGVEAHGGASCEAVMQQAGTDLCARSGRLAVAHPLVGPGLALVIHLPLP